MATNPMAISTFKADFDGGTRPNRFKVVLPESAGGQSLMVKAASIPAETVGILQVPFRGRVAKLPGDRSYAEWTFTVLDDITKNIRSSVIDWHRRFNPHETNVVEEGVLGGSAGLEEITVTQLDMKGADHTSVTLKDCWPVEVGAIDLSYDKADTLVEFAVTIAYDWIA
jgi:hypothetical protein